MGILLEWDFIDFYLVIDVLEVVVDFKELFDCLKIFEIFYKGRFVEFVEDNVVVLVMVICVYEDFEDLLGWLIFFVGLVYVGNMIDFVL